MGTDAGFFAKKAKKYFWFDRLYNLDAVWDLEAAGALWSIRDTLTEDKDNQLSVETITNFLERNIECWMRREESQRYHAEWVRGALAFVKAHPDDQFFVATSDGDAYDLIGDMHGRRDSWRGEYAEWLPPDNA
jgi:hypothetical protein